MTPLEQHLYNGGHSAFINGLNGSRYYSTDIYGQLINPYTAAPALNSANTTASTNTHHHHPSHQQQQQAQNNSSTMRTIYLGNVKSDINICDIMDQVKTGQIQSIRALPEKNGLFITFVESNAAAQFYYESINRSFIIKGHELKVGWGKPSHLTTSVQTALQNGASRNVYLGLLDENMMTTENEIRQNLSRFGHIEKIKVIPEKRIAFIHFLCISNAVKCVNTLQTESQWQTKRVNFGKDRCAPPSSIQQQQQKMYILPATAVTAAATTATSINSNGYHPFLHHHQPLLMSTQATTPLSPPLIQNNNTTATYDIHTGLPLLQYHHNSHYPAQQQHTQQYQRSITSPSSNNSHYSLGGLANRTIYIGNIHPDTTSEDICNVIRGGILSQIRFMPDKHIAFITFVDPILAENFYNTTECLVIKNRRLKLGWGKPSQLPLTVINAVQNGGSRNVYIGNIDDLITEEKLKHDFSEYGDIELVNTLKEKNCAFVNFTSIAGAVRAIEGIRSKEEYKKFRINYGKDRCGNPPKYMLGGSSMGNDASNVEHYHQNGILLNGDLDRDHAEEEEEPTTTTTTTTSNITTPNNNYNHINKPAMAAVAENEANNNNHDQYITSSPIVASMKLY